MSCCGYRTVNGAPPGSVPAGVALVDGWEPVLSVDFREIPNIDLNGNGITFVDQGVTWSSPTTIVAGVTTFAITAAGLVVDMTGVNSRISSTSQNAPHVWTPLGSIPGYSAARELLVMAYFSTMTRTLSTEIGFVANYAPVSGPAGRLPAADARCVSNGVGFANGADNTIRLLAVTASTTFVPVPVGTDVVAVRQLNGTNLEMMAGRHNAPTWPAPSELGALGPFLAGSVLFEDEYFSDEIYNRIAAGFSQEHLTAVQMSGTLQQLEFFLK